MNLINGTPEDIRQFVTAVVGLAVKEHREGVSAGVETTNLRSGNQIANLVGADNRRIFHDKMASTIYAQTIKTLRCFDAER